MAHGDLAAVVQRGLSRDDGRAWGLSYAEHRARTVRVGVETAAAPAGEELCTGDEL